MIFNDDYFAWHFLKGVKLIFLKTLLSNGHTIEAIFSTIHYLRYTGSAGENFSPTPTKEMSHVHNTSSPVNLEMCRRRNCKIMLQLLSKVFKIVVLRLWEYILCVTLKNEFLNLELTTCLHLFSHKCCRPFCRTLYKEEWDHFFKFYRREKKNLYVT